MFPKNDKYSIKYEHDIQNMNHHYDEYFIKYDRDYTNVKYLS